MGIVRALLLLSLLVASGIALAQGGPRGGQKVMVETARAETATLVSTQKAVGTLLADASAELRAEIPGQILAIHFDEGQPVEAGDKLVSIEASVLEAEVNEARANAARSEAEYARAKELFARKLISETDYDQARADNNVDTARLRYAEARLAKTVIRAPFAGFTGLRRINVGDYATTSETLIELVRLDPLRVDFSVPETVLPKLRVGQPIDVEVDAYPGEAFSGRITAIAPRVDVEGHNVQVRASLANPDLKLRPGLFARIEIQLASKPDSVVVPEQAIWPVGENKTVFVVVDGKAEQRTVTLGERQSGVVEVVAGVERGEEIVTAGQMKIYDGAAVQSVTGQSTAEL